MDNQITEEQAAAMAKEFDEMIKGTDAEIVQNFPSNNGVETREGEPEEGEARLVNVATNPETGEAQIIDTKEVEEDPRSFDEKVQDKIDDFDIDFDNRSPVSEEEFDSYLKDENNLLSEIDKNKDISEEDIKVILEITNRRINKENFNVYKALPESVQNQINNYLNEGREQMQFPDRNAYNYARNNIAELMIDEFKDSILIERAKHDFANELANIYKEGSENIASESLSVVENRNKAYREAAEKIEDEEKKARMIAILDQIDEARALTKLKEFAKSVKIKKIEFEKTEARVFRSFLNKYRNSTNNIYDIGVCWRVLFRHLSPEYDEYAINAFFIAFCKQVQSYDINNPVDHAYIYYVLYYCAMLDGDKSDIFKNNVKEVIDILESRYHDIMR